MANLNSLGYSVNPGEPVCQFYQKTGLCKFGATCRFDHPEEFGHKPLNSAGYPLNHGSEDCQYYCKTGTCKYGPTCKYNHPEGLATSVAQMPPGPGSSPPPIAAPPPAQKVAIWGATPPPKAYTGAKQLNSAGYPIVHNTEDCQHFMRTGECKYGSNCKWNHPEGMATAVAPDYHESVAAAHGSAAPPQVPTAQGVGTAVNSAGYPLNPGSPDCAFYMKTGQCKFASTCKFNHPEGLATQVAGAPVTAPGAYQSGSGGKTLNSAGYPLAPGVEDCQHFLKTGTCKYSSSCKYNHPEGYATQIAQAPVASPSAAAPPRPAPGQRPGTTLNSAGYPLAPGIEDCQHFLRTGQCKWGSGCKYNHPEGLATQIAPGAEVALAAQSAPAPAAAAAAPTWGQPAPAAAAPAAALAAIGDGTTNSQGYPLNPGQADCAFYIKTGQCKFGSTCKFNHPEGAGGTAAAGEATNSLGYPLRPGQEDCAYYVKTGQCKFSATCKYNHPEPNGSAPPAESDHLTAALNELMSGGGTRPAGGMPEGEPPAKRVRQGWS
mmetsp:Transcript_37130/g.78757  ORF Transcript_37130/g.78757 Transcript_37130/m.78757 type:complete len:545 (+) Transcript_37130:128-1762(+)